MRYNHQRLNRQIARRLRLIYTHWPRSLSRSKNVSKIRTRKFSTVSKERTPEFRSRARNNLSFDFKSLIIWAGGGRGGANQMKNKHLHTHPVLQKTTVISAADVTRRQESGSTSATWHTRLQVEMHSKLCTFVTTCFSGDYLRRIVYFVLFEIARGFLQHGQVWGLLGYLATTVPSTVLAFRFDSWQKRKSAVNLLCSAEKHGHCWRDLKLQKHSPVRKISSWNLSLVLISSLVAETTAWLPKVRSANSNPQRMRLYTCVCNYMSVKCTTKIWWLGKLSNKYRTHSLTTKWGGF